jgi:hypothetical protein
MRFWIPTLNDCKSGARLAFFMLAGGVAGAIIGFPVSRTVTTNNAGLVEIESSAIGALIGAAAGLLIHLGVSVVGPQINALNARLQADSWSGPK